MTTIRVQDIAGMRPISGGVSIDLSGAPVLTALNTPTSSGTATVRPFGIYMRVDDVIECFAFATNSQNDVVIVTGRTVGMDGTVHDFQFNSPQIQTGSNTPFTYSPGEGFLMSLGFTPLEANDQQGDFLFLQVGLRSAQTASGEWYAVLFSDRLSEDYSLGWPGTIVKAPIEVSPIFLFTQGTVESDNDIFFTTSSAQVWEVSSVYLVLAAGAGGSPRAPTLFIAPTGSSFTYRCTSSVTCAAGATQEYIFMPGINPFTDGAGRSFNPLPNPCLVWPTGTHATLGTDTANIQPGDAYTTHYVTGRMRLDIG